MRPVPRRDFTSAPSVIAALLFVCALTFYYFAVLKFDYHRTRLLDLGWSDPSEYFGQAKAMLRGELPYVNFGYEKLPSRYPVGYPALMVPWLKVLPEADSVLAPYRTNQTIGLLLLLAMFGFYSYLRMPLAGGFSALLLATLPAFFTSCRSPMSELSTSAFVVLAFMFTYLGLKEERRWKIYLSAIFLGLSVNIRMQSLFFAPLLLAMALFPTPERRLRWFLHCLAVSIVFVLAVSPTLMLNTIQFHSPFKTGYDFWLANWPNHPPFFSPRYIPSNIALLWREFALLQQKFSSANAYGTGTFFVPAFVILVCVGAFFVRLDQFVVCALVAGLSFFLLTTSYFDRWVDIRFYLPLLILLVAVAVLPVIWAAENLFVVKRTVASLVIFLFFVATCLGYPSRSVGDTPKAHRLQVWQALHFLRLPRQSQEFIAQRHFVQLFGQHPGMVLADINPVYLNALLPNRFVALPLDEKRYIAFRDIVTYDSAEALALVRRGLAQSLPVYALFVSREEMEEKATRLPQVDGYAWILAENPTAEAAILKLSPTG
jgi:4-amino-4-deoxy-L-arabinose transferase-like glycosyltransferase